MKKRVWAAAIAAMCFVGTAPVSAVPIAGVAENESLEEVAIKNEPGIKDTITEFGTGGEWTNPESSDIMLKNMTLNDVIELAKKGDELDWADFKGYNGKDVGSGQDIWEYKFDDGYVLRVIGVTDKKPDYILLSHNNEKGIDIRTNDVKEYIASTATPVVTENEKVEAVMLTTEEGNDGCYIHLDLASGTFGMSGSIYQNFAIFGKFERKGNDLYLYAENGSTNVYVLQREEDHFISQSDERGMKLSKGLVFSADNDAFWEKIFDLTPPENESNNTGKTQDYSFEDILNMSSDELNKLFESKGMTWDKGFKVFSPDNTLQAYSVCISPKPYMQSVKGDELVTEVKDANDIYKLFTDGDVIWNINKIYSSLGISPELFEIKANVSFTHATGNEETGSVYRKYCRCFLTPITTDKETYNTLLAAALNYVQLNPDFVEIYFEAPGAGGGGMNIPSTVNIKGDANSNGNETCYSGGECEDGVMIVPETEDGKIVTEIYLWSDDNIKALKIPATVNKVDIIKCLNLEKIEVSEDNPYLCSVDGVIYSKDMKTLVFYPSSKSETAFIVPDTVEVIREGAFNYAQKLKSVKLSDGVKIIKDSAFFGTKITDFELPETLTDIEQYAFSGNNSLTSITLPASLKHVESPFLECEALTEIVLLHEIGDEHFESSGPRNPDDDYYSALLRNGSNITVFVPDNSYEDYNKYYKDRWKCKNILPLSKYEKNTIKGDTNCDGSVDMADAVLIMQALANPNKYGIDGTAEHHLTEQGKLNGDMKGDGLTVGDALAIQGKLLGLDEKSTDLEALRKQLSNFFAEEKIDYSVITKDKMPEQFSDKYVFIKVNTVDTGYAARYGAFLKEKNIDSSLIKSIPYKIDSDTELNKIRALLYCYILENNIKASVDPTNEEEDLKNKTVLVKYADSSETRSQLETFLEENNIDPKMIDFYAYE